jgi:predicted nucleic acid-binding Zn ribbon protein
VSPEVTPPAAPVEIQQPMVEVGTVQPFQPQTIAPRPAPDRAMPPYRSLPESNCMRCSASIPRGEALCSACSQSSSKTSKVKIFAGLFVVLGVIGFFGFDWALAKASPWGVLRRYAKATGTNSTIVFENFLIKGEMRVVPLGMVGIDHTKVDSQIADLESRGTAMSFKSVFKKPNMAGVEMTRPDGTVIYKQVFDGVSGWRYVNMDGKPSTQEDNTDAFASKKMGLSLEEYDSVEFADETKLTPYNTYIEPLAKKEKFRVSDIEQTSGTKTFIIAKQKHNGTIEESVLAFDEATGFLIGILKKVDINGKPSFTTIFFDNYEKTQVATSGILGLGKSRILIPKKITILTTFSVNPGANTTMLIVMNVRSFEADAQIEEGFFSRK